MLAVIDNFNLPFVKIALKVHKEKFRLRLAKI